MKQRYFILSILFTLGYLFFPSPASADPFAIREMTGIIEAIRFSDPLEGSNILGEADVVNGLGKKITVLITLDTAIRDPNWHLAHVVYLTKGDRIKIRYQITREGHFQAQDIHVLKR